MIHENSVERGWWESERVFGTLLAPCHSELSEVLEEIRKLHEVNETYYSDSGKMKRVPSELADVVIRNMDICEYYSIDFEAILLEKHEYNKKRQIKHGNKRL